MRFTMTVECDNDAFQDDSHDELRRILVLVSRQLVAGVPGDESAIPLRDINGNTVGSWTLTDA